MEPGAALVPLDEPPLLPEIVRPRIGPMSPEAIARVRQLEEMVLAAPQVPIFTDHVIHGGMYARTVFIPAGVVITGALVKVPTTLIVHGDAVIYLDQVSVQVSGYNVVAASAGRKQAFVAVTDVYLTMMVQTDATTVDEAERAFTDDFEQLASHRDEQMNSVTVTGE